MAENGDDTANSENPQTQTDTNIDPEDNTIYVGSKPPMSYVLAVATQFSEGQDTVYVKARGKAISTAVDVAEIVRKRFVDDAELQDITIDTDEIEGDDGETMNVSSISLTLGKTT